MIWCYGTLCHTRNAILSIGVPLSRTMKVKRSPIVLHLIYDIDLHPVTPIGVDGWAWVLVVDEKDLTLDAIEGSGRVGNGEGVGAGFASQWPLLEEVGVDVVAIGPAVAGGWGVEAVFSWASRDVIRLCFVRR